MKQCSRSKENGGASKTNGRSQDWPTQKAVVQNRAGKAPAADDDFFNLNQPSGERQELFDNYEMFYKEQARMESSLSGSRNNISSTTIQYKKAANIQDNIDETEELEEEPISPFKISPNHRPSKVVWQADDITVAMQQSVSQSEISLGLRKSLPSQIHLQRHKENRDLMLVTKATSQSNLLYKHIRMEEASPDRCLAGLHSPPIRYPIN